MCWALGLLVMAPLLVLPAAKDITLKRPGVGSTGGTEPGAMRSGLGSATHTGCVTLDRLPYFSALKFSKPKEYDFLL